MLSRRGLITGLISFAAAPAIVRASSLMPVKVMTPEISMRFITDYIASANPVKLDIVYGMLYYTYVEDKEIKIKLIDYNEFYKDGGWL